MQGYADQVGLSHVKPHDFRHFVGTQIAERDIRKVQQALGYTPVILPPTASTSRPGAC